MLHHTGYRDKLKDCLKRELPRIPFAGFGSAGVSPAPTGASRARQTRGQDARVYAAGTTALPDFRALGNRSDPNRPQIRFARLGRTF
ncbi:MAG: hypothetical protein ICCCNLDF_00824 [Planctomycetes bacterium]|nr:hypothetical protein [Planctomycetota bacterium]